MVDERGSSFCTECGEEMANAVKFCGACGSPAGDAPGTQVVTAEPVAVVAVDEAHRPRPRWKKKRYWVPAVLVVLIIIASATSGGDKPAPSSADTPPAAADVSEVAAAAPEPSPADKATSDARAYIAEHRRQINVVHVSVQSVQAAVELAQASPTSETLYQLAQIAQEAHDYIDNVRQDLTTSDSSGALYDAEIEVFAAANDLKNSMGALVAYTGDPTPATLAHFTSEYRPAVTMWNDGVRIIWRIAHRAKPPTL